MDSQTVKGRRRLVRFGTITLGTFFGLTAVIFFYFMPISNHLVRYLWWKLTAHVPSRHGTVVSLGATLHYTVCGQGEPLLMLHGGLSNKLCWFSQIPELSRRGYQLILPDSRGHGLSELGKGELSYRVLAADAAAILDDLHLQRTDVLGWSDGANTALLMATMFPQRVGRIVAISGNYDPRGLTPAAKEANTEQLMGVRSWLYRWWTGAGEKFKDLENRLKKLWRSSPIVTEQDLAQISAPVLLIIGDHDVVTLEHARTMSHLIPHCRLHIIHVGGHATLITHAREVNGQIQEFLKVSPR